MRTSRARRLLPLAVAAAALAFLVPGAGSVAVTGIVGIGSQHQMHDTDFPGPSLDLGAVLQASEAPAGSDIRVNDIARPGQLVGCTVQSETSLVGFGSNVYVGFNDAQQCEDALAAPSGIAWSGFSRSTDGGLTFTDAGPLQPSGEAVDLWGDPALAVDTTGTDSGTLYYASLCDDDAGRFAICLGVSTDSGATFQWHHVPPTSDNNADKEWIAVDNSGGPYDGTVYLTWTDFGASGAPIKVTRSTDQGATWSSPRTLGSGSVQASRPAVGPNGEVYVIWEAGIGSSPKIMWSRSTNGGLTYSAGKAATPSFKPSGHTQNCLGGNRQVMNGDIRTLEFPSVSVDTSGSSDPLAADYNPYRGTVYVAYHAGATGDEGDVYLARLLPGGTAFEPPQKMNDDTTTTDQWMPEVVAAGFGKVLVTWIDRREDASQAKPVGDRMMRQYMAISSDGGATFAPNTPLSSTPYPPSFTNPNINTDNAWCYMGDYNGLSSDRPGHVLASWGDNRDTIRVSGTTDTKVIPDPNVYFRQLDV